MTALRGRALAAGGAPRISVWAMILCCGEALIDMLPCGLPGGAQGFMPVAGGAALNSAIAIGRLGGPAGLLTGLSSDFFGDILRGKLEASGVDCRHVVTAGLPTTLAFVRLVDGQARYSFYDENTAGRMLAEADVPALSPAVDAALFGGISLIAEPCGTTYETLMRRHAPNCVMMLDPNIRPGFVDDETAYRGRIDRMIALADVVRLSDEDLDWLCGEGDAEENAAALLSRGPKIVILTRGAAGAIGLTARYRLDVGSPTTAVVDTVGAGDTFNAGVLTLLHERGRLSKPAVADLGEADLRAALVLAARAAAITVGRAGADPPWRSEVAEGRSPVDM